MPLFFIYLKILDNYKEFVNDILKYLTLLIVFQYLYTRNYKIIKKPFNSKFLNDSFIYLIMFIVIGLMSYYLIIQELLEII